MKKNAGSLDLQDVTKWANALLLGFQHFETA